MRSGISIPDFHETLAPEFRDELLKYGRIYMYRFRPDYRISARRLDDFPYKSVQAGAIIDDAKQ